MLGCANSEVRKNIAPGTDIRRNPADKSSHPGFGIKTDYPYEVHAHEVHAYEVSLALPTSRVALIALSGYYPGTHFIQGT